MTLTSPRPDAPVLPSTDQPPALGEETVPALPDAVEVPAYDRSQLEPAVVHIGVGGFHRAHQAGLVAAPRLARELEEALTALEDGSLAAAAGLQPGADALTEGQAA